MKKAVIVGGSNGIGLAIAVNLIRRGYHPVIADRCKPEDIPGQYSGSYDFIATDLLDFDQELFESLAEDCEIEFLMLTAGIGRVSNLEYLHTGEIENILTINTVSALKILRIFYERMLGQKPFYTGVMVSIAGLVSSPMFSVYAASKAADARFIESVNIELEAAGSHNRILNISPGSLKGTKFNGGQNDLCQTEKLAEEIVSRVLGSEEIYIPQYEEIFRGVIAQYQQDPHAYGLHSYRYKLSSGRTYNEHKAKIGYLSGTFDLFHIGHLNLLRRAKAQCDYLIVGVHKSGSWKGKETFISLEERKEIVAACKYVDKVVDSCPEDSQAWELWHYNKLFVGSDYKGSQRFQKYEQYFSDKDVQIVYFPYTKCTSSTQLRIALKEKSKEE